MLLAFTRQEVASCAAAALLLLCPLLAAAAAEQGGAPRWLLLPLRAWAITTDVTVALGPATWVGALAIWNWLALPEWAGASQRVAQRLQRSISVSLVVLCALAAHGRRIERWALLAYVVVASPPAVYLCLGLSIRRFIFNFAYALPIIAHYWALDAWEKYAKAPAEVLEDYRKRVDERYAPWLFDLMVKQGGLYVKLGQFLSLIPVGTLPEAYHSCFKRLQGEVTPLPAAEVRALLGQAYGRPLGEVFGSFEDEPLGAASVGQVHRARLAADGRDVVVKVKYPGVESGVWADFYSIKMLIRLFKPDWLGPLQHTTAWAAQELNLKLEAEVLRRISTNLRQPFPRVHVPEPIDELCTPNVVVMTFVPGVSLLQTLLRMANVVLGSSSPQALEWLAAEAPEAPGGDEAPRPAHRGAAGYALAAALTALLTLARRRRGVLRRTLGLAFRGSLLASSGALALALLSEARQRWQAPDQPVVPVVRAALVKLLLHVVAGSRSCTNACIAIYNHTAGRLGARPIRYRQVIPKFNPVELSILIWRVQGHQMLVDGLFNCDSHPGNYLVDESTGRLGLLDFGQSCELSLEMRVLFARQVVALADGDEQLIALRHAQLGFRSSRMSAQMMAAHAALKYGPMTVAGLEGLLKRTEALKEWDPVEEPHDTRPELMLVDRMITLLRGTTAMLGAPMDVCCATVVWLPMAQALLAQHDEQFPVQDFEFGHERLPEPQTSAEPERKS